MSFCRWSSMDFSCDLYCYESGEGFVTHVASSRVVGDIPKLDWSFLQNPKSEDNMEKFLKSQEEQFKFLDTAKRETIGLPSDGTTFVDQTVGDFLTRLATLKEQGYNFPEITKEDLC